MKISWIKSFRGKILFLSLSAIFFAGLFFIVTLATFESVFNLLMKSEKITLFVDYIFEMRRYEKNYFLYHHQEDLKTLRYYLQETKNLLKELKKDLLSLMGHKSFLDFQENLLAYENLLEAVESKKNSEETYERFRLKGKIITHYAEELNKLREKQIFNSLKDLQNWLLILFALFIFFIFIYVFYFYLSITRPFKKLENYILQIIQGKFCAIPPDFEEREMQLLVEAINKMLAELDRRKEYLIQTERLATFGTLLFSLAHEINNPLNNIYTSCQILKEEIESENTDFKKELLEEMEKEIERTQKIIRSILDYSKPGERERTNLKNLVEEALYLLKGKIPPKVEFQLEIPEDLTLYVDPQQMKQVFINLFKNAIEAFGDKEGRIQVQGYKEAHNVIIRFSDNGPGIPAKILPHIFDPFFTTKEKKGYGLGLFIVYNLIKNHGGEIEVESEVGKGTTFIIKLPEGERLNHGEGKSQNSRD